jgi:gliding motility-associated-like protein
LRIKIILFCFLAFGQLLAQCPQITQTTVNPNCIPSCELCSGEKFTITLQGGDLPHNGKVDYYADVNPGFNPYAGQGTKIGSANIVTPNPKCRVCPVLLGFMIDACGTEAKNEFMVIWTGSGFNTSDFNFDYAPQNNTGGAPNADIGPGGCGITNGNAGLVGGCSATSVGSNFDLPPNAIWIVFTSVTAFTNYDFSTACALSCKVFVSSSTCDRVIGAFSNFDATPGSRTQVMTITGCACSTVAMYDVPGSLTGNGDFWAEGSIVNNGCATPGLSSPNYTPATSTVDPFMYTIPPAWCDKSYEIVGILNPKPDVNCCMEVFTERFTVNVKCPKANPAIIEMCETNNGQSIFTLEDANTDVLAGSNGTVTYYKDMAGTMIITSPYLSGNATIYAKVTDGKCSSTIVPVTLKVLLLPVAKAASAELCDDGSGFATFDLTKLEQTIKNGFGGTMVKFFQDINKTIPVNSPFTTSSTTIYATIADFKCESKPVAIVLTVNKKPEAFETSASACPEGDGKATFRLIDLIQIITNNQPGTNVKFYEDDLLTKEITPPYRTASDTIFAVVTNAKCSSEPVAIILMVSSLNKTPLVIDKNCDDGNGTAKFDLLNVIKILQGADTTISIKWYADSVQSNQIIPPVYITGKDTIYAFLFKDSCTSKHIPIILEAIKRPKAKAYDWFICSADKDSLIFDLRTIRDSINQNSGLAVVFSKDSLLTKLVSSSYYTSGDTLYAATLDGSCASIPVKIILKVFKSPLFDTLQDQINCQEYVLPPLTGKNLSPFASYYSSTGTKGIKWSAGDTINRSSMIYVYDSISQCIAQDSFYVDIIRKPQAGSDQSISVCEGSLVNLMSYLTNADAGGIFEDTDASGSLMDSIFNASSHNGKTFRFQYLVNANSYCPGDTAIISVQVVKELSAGRDTSITICENEILDLFTLLPSADAGGQFRELTTSALNQQFWDAKKAGPGVYKIYYTIGDSIICPKKTTTLDITVEAAIDINPRVNQIHCEYYILPSITGKNIPGDAAYYSQMNGQGIKYNPGDTIFSNTGLYMYGNQSGFCPDEEYFFIVIKPVIFGSTVSAPYCMGDSVLIGKNYYSFNRPIGIERYGILASNGCDSVYRAVGLLSFPSSGDLFEIKCANEFILINGKRYDINNPTGIEVLKSGNMYGCDSTININLIFQPLSQFDYTDQICTNEQLIINGKIYDSNNLNGSDTIINGSVNGCDSIIHVKLTSIPVSKFTFRNTICLNDTITLGNLSFHKNNSALLDTLQGLSFNGCDSIRDIQIQFFPEVIGSINQTLCENDFLIINNTRYDINNPTGTEILKNAAASSCDSTVQIALNFKNSVSSNYNASFCENKSIVINGKLYDKNKLSGVDTLKGLATGGCDSIVIIQLQTLANKQTIYRDTLCPNDFIIINGKRYNASTPSGTEYITASNGCDSIVSIDLRFSNLDVSYPKELFLTPGQSQILQIIPAFVPASILWSPSTGLSCTDCLNPVINPTTTTSYSVTLTDQNGCSINLTITVRLDVDEKVFVPNAFSPNGDNINDIFRVISDNPNIFISDFAIFDRWGNRMYYESNQTLTDHHGWNGSTQQDEKLNPGVYVYYIKLNIPGAEDKILFGDVTLIR